MANINLSEFGNQFKDITGQRFERLVALKPIKKRSQGGSVWWSCLCDCGNICNVKSTSLRLGRTKSCGCLRKEGITTHGLTYHPLYKIWECIIQRCENSNNIAYNRYGARGIKICDEWRNNPKTFIEWALANGWEEELTIDRWPNNNGNYEPGNVRFATALEQANNTRHLKLFIAYGPCGQVEIAKNQSAFARKWGLGPSNISACMRGKQKTQKGWVFEKLYTQDG